MKHVEIVTNILNECADKNDFDISIEALSKQYNISHEPCNAILKRLPASTANRHCKLCGYRKAIEHLATSPDEFSF